MERLVDDPLLPAAPYLVSNEAFSLVAEAVAAADGELCSLESKEVVYRPKRELIARYAAAIAWSGGSPTNETIMAATSVDGPPPGTLVLEPEHPPVAGMQVGVWRYPFDPMLPGLGTAVVPRTAAALLGLDAEQVRLDVVSFRPCRRAVVRCRSLNGDTYLKLVPPGAVAALVARHRHLLDSGIIVPEVRSVDEELGLVALSSLPGRDLRQCLMDGESPLPDPAAITNIVTVLARLEAPPGAEVRSSLLDDAPRHLQMLRLVEPGCGILIDQLLEGLMLDDRGGSWPGTVHGDFHDAQVRIDDGGDIIGLLDVDGLGAGDVLDDLGRFQGHLEALALAVPAQAVRIRAFATRVRREWSNVVPEDELARRTAAALAGLASGPFRTQQRQWRSRVRALLEAAWAFARTSQR